MKAGACDAAAYIRPATINAKIASHLEENMIWSSLRTAKRRTDGVVRLH
jgi:hypothetical protein